MKLFDYATVNTEKSSGITDVGDVFEQLVTMTTPDLPAGVYMIGFSWEANFNEQKNRPFETQLTGTFAGAIYSDSVGDNDVGIKTRMYGFPKTWGGGVITLGMQGRKSASFSAQLDVDYIDVMVRRIG